MPDTKRYLRRCGFCRELVAGLCLCPGAHAAREARAVEAMKKRQEPSSPRVREALAKLTPEEAESFWK